VLSGYPRKALWATASAPASTVVNAGPWQEDARVASPTDASLCLGGDTVKRPRVSPSHTVTVVAGLRGEGGDTVGASGAIRRSTSPIPQRPRALTHSRDPRCPRKERITEASFALGQ
jgi:hypothetical protein